MTIHYLCKKFMKKEIGRKMKTIILFYHGVCSISVKASLSRIIIHFFKFDLF